MAGVKPSNLIANVVNPEGYITAAAFIPPHSYSELGREGTLTWFQYGVQHQVAEGWTPFDNNRSVSRRQLSLMPGESNLTIIGISDNSRTTMTAPEILSVK